MKRHWGLQLLYPVIMCVRTEKTDFPRHFCSIPLHSEDLEISQFNFQTFPDISVQRSTQYSRLSRNLDTVYWSFGWCWNFITDWSVVVFSGRKIQVELASWWFENLWQVKTNVKVLQPCHAGNASLASVQRYLSVYQTCQSLTRTTVINPLCIKI